MTTSAMGGVIIGIDFNAIAIHEAVSGFAFTLATNQTFTTFVVAGTTVIDICCGIEGRLTAMGCAITGYTYTIFTNQAVCTSICTTAASVDDADLNGLAVAIGYAVSEFARSTVTYLRIGAAVVACATVIQIIEGIAQDAVTNGRSQATATGAGLVTFTGIIV